MIVTAVRCQPRAPHMGPAAQSKAPATPSIAAAIAPLLPKRKEEAMAVVKSALTLRSPRRDLLPQTGQGNLNDGGVMVRHVARLDLSDRRRRRAHDLRNRSPAPMGLARRRAAGGGVLRLYPRSQLPPPPL